MKSARLVPGHAPIYSKEAAVRGNVICFATHSYGRAGFALMGGRERASLCFSEIGTALVRLLLRKAVPLYKRDI